MILHICRPFQKEMLIRIEDESRLSLQELERFASLMPPGIWGQWFSKEEMAFLDSQVPISQLPVADQDHLLVFAASHLPCDDPLQAKTEDLDSHLSDSHLDLRGIL